jgi:DNA polymerase I
MPLTLNCNLNLQRFKVLYICGNYSSVLSRLDRRFQDLDIRRAFTVFQLMTILEEARHSLIIIEHDPMLYEDAQGMVEYVSQGLHDAAKETAVLLYSPGTDTFLEDVTKNADRVFYFDEGPRATTKLISKAYPKAQKSQTTLRLGMIKLPWKRDANQSIIILNGKVQLFLPKPMCRLYIMGMGRMFGPQHPYCMIAMAT